jgi:cyclopropane-fatty-acyl-phospholipid synthase
MTSRVYEALVRHERRNPAVNEFEYRVPVFVFDLAELESGTLDGPLFGRRGHSGRLPRLFSMDDRDYLHDGNAGLRTKLVRVLESAGLDSGLARNEVLLITSARFLGRVFNPVSFWMLLAEGTPGGLAAVVAEVNNTFGEKHLYVLADGGPTPFPARFSATKQFHVSPFNDMRGTYSFAFEDPRQGIGVAIDLAREAGIVLSASLRSQGHGLPVTTRTLARFAVKPQHTLTFPRILKEAARLHFRKKLPVHSKPEPQSAMTIRRKGDRPLGLDRLARRFVLWRLRGLGREAVVVKLPDGTSSLLGPSGSPPAAVMSVKDWRMFRQVLLRGEIGLGETYVDGLWSTTDLPGLFSALLCNRKPIHRRERPNRLENLTQYLTRSGRPKVLCNSLHGSRCNIAAHYDLSNEFFAEFLDPTMTYSCALFSDPDNPVEPLEQAQRRKLRRIGERAGIRPGHEVLEIGCGWGGFAVYAATECGCRVTAVTLSRKQYDHVVGLVARLGLEDRITPVLSDYRDLEGTYDAVVSIEMIEAVGHEFHKHYFRAIDRLLRPGGKASLQAITILDQRYDAYRRERDWINTYIFPGGLLPSLSRIAGVVEAHTGLVITKIDDIGPHYAPTLAAWRGRFLRQWPSIEAMGFDDRFRRTFEYYFALCETGFRQGYLHDLQLVLERPRFVTFTPNGGH